MSIDDTVAANRSIKVRRQIDHPVVDADGHWIEPFPIFLEFLRDVGGAKTVDQFRENRRNRSEVWYRMSAQERQHARLPRPTWWAFPADTRDRATAMLPALLSERMDEFGLDFALIYPSMGLLSTTIADEDVRRPLIRALNMMSAEMFRSHSAKMTPTAIIPSFTPTEAIEEAEFAVNELGLKAAFLNGTIRRPIGAIGGATQDNYNTHPYYIDNLVLDSERDYDPVWKKFVELGLAVTTHSGSARWVDRSSPTNFVFNHIGHFAQSNHVFARALFIAGVPRRFPQLNFAFLEGGVGWAAMLLTDLVGHWEKRTRSAVLANLQPSNVDLAQIRTLIQEYGGERVAQHADALLESLDCFFPETSVQALTERELDLELDDFAATKLTSKTELRDMFSRQFFFGCEADDPATTWAFDSRFTRLKAMFSSDIAHFDVTDMSDVLGEAYELVEKGMIAEDDFKAFTFGNIVDLHGSMNPDFFSGTAVEAAAKEELQARGRYQTPAPHGR